MDEKLCSYEKCNHEGIMGKTLSVKGLNFKHLQVTIKALFYNDNIKLYLPINMHPNDITNTRI